jgi:hypothetical protein
MANVLALSPGRSPPAQKPLRPQKARSNCGDAITTNVAFCQAASVSAWPPVISFFDSLYHFLQHVLRGPEHLMDCQRMS